MTKSIPERDWKYLRRIQKEMLFELYLRINRKSAEILNAKEESQGEKYHKLYKHIKDSDEIIANCFDDWRRSNISFKMLFLLHHNLFTDDRIEGLSEKGAELVERLKTFNKVTDN